jgi:hypothetical protein
LQRLSGRFGVLKKPATSCRKGQVRNISGRDIKAQAEFIAGLFHVAA